MDNGSSAAFGSRRGSVETMPSVRHFVGQQRKAIPQSVRFSASI